MKTVGIDEVGRGCWAGPVVAGAVLLAQPVPGLTDSKKLSKKQREAFVLEIESSGAAIGIGWVDAPTVDEIGLTEAVRLAMRRALEQITQTFNEVIIDGNYNFLPDVHGSRALIKADLVEPSVSAASIVAKVARDKYMSGLRDEYGFAQHVGYGTALHMERLQQYGVSDQHRKSFKPIAKLLQLD
jgi:ribonuclease HII